MIHLAPLMIALTAVGLLPPGIDLIEIHGNQYIARISTANNFEAELVITFESPDLLLAVTSLDVSATEVVPTSLQARLPPGVFLPARFPVVIQVDQGSDLLTAVTFDNGYSVALRTPDLELRSYSPYRLFKAHNGGAFEDLTSSIGLGSYRARGTSGSFSEFVIAADMRPQGQILEQKYQDIQTVLDDENGVGITAGTYNVLNGELGASYSAFQAANLPLAVDNAEAMLGTIDAESGISIEASYDGGADVSLAGDLTGAVESLRAALEIAAMGDPVQTEAVSKHLTTGGGHSLLFQVTFEGRQAIDLDQLGVSAEDVDPIDPGLLARLPAGVQIPAEFPVLIHVDPGSNDEQVFRGEVAFEAETGDVDFLTDSNLRLFKAPDGGAFTDITATYGLGSYRARGTSGSFSELMLVRDLRGNAAVISDKFQALDTLLQSHQADIDAGVYATLSTLFGNAQTAYQNSDLDTAKDQLDAFVDLVETQSGEGVPDIWVSTAGSLRVNVAAKLLGAARSVRFNLVIEQSPATDPADANQDGVVDELDVFYILNRVFPSPS